MIKTIQLVNFQNHESSLLVLSPGVNIIAGPSDNGKSAIIRALRWVFFNKPQGDGLMKNGAEYVLVDVTMDNHSVGRSKSKKVNTYILDKTEFKAMRGTVPEEISSVLNVNAANIQSQHDPYYMLTMSPGDVARHLSAIAGLGVIDVAIKKANSLITCENTKAKVIEEAIIKGEAELGKYKDVDSIIAITNRLTRSVQNKEKTEDRIATLQNGIKSAKEGHGNLEKLNTFLTAEPLLIAAEDQCSSAKQRAIVRERLGKYIAQYRVCVAGIETIQAKCTGYEDIEKFEDVLEKYKEQRARCQSIMQFCHDIDRLQHDIQGYTGMIESDEASLAKLSSTLKICPTCGATMVISQA